MRFFLPVAFLIALAPATASAVTIREIVSLSRAGVSEPVILALIDRDKTIFTLQAEDLVTLQKEGVSDAVVLAMLRSGRDEPPPPQVTEAPLPEPPAPEIVVVGHGPDRPNARGDYGADVGTAVPAAVPYFVPVPYPVVVAAPARPRCVIRTETPIDAGSEPTGVFFRNASRGIFFPNPPAAARVTECLPAPARPQSQRR